MGEVQKHGKVWEKHILCAAYGCTEDELKGIGYTAAKDLPAHLNHLNGVTISMKCRGEGGEVCMGDALRVYDAAKSGEAVHMTLCTWTQSDPTTKKVVNLMEVDLAGAFDALFGSLTREQVALLDARVKKVPQKRRPTEEEHAAMYALKEALEAQTGAIKLRIKCDSKQSRLQCAFSASSFQGFLDANPGRIVATMVDGQFHGKPVLMEVTSSPRVFKKKTMTVIVA
jgi:hypothetical protein